MVNKRGRKRKNDMYFGPSEEEAVIKFLDSRYVEKIDVVAGKPFKVYHNLGKNIIVNITYQISNENCYGNDSKFIDIDLDIETNNYTDTSVVITPHISINNATLIIVNETERDLIYNEWLKEPLNKMVESIIRRYKLYRKGETFEELHSDTISFLITKVHKFEAGRGKKAYSYFGTIAKNYILGLLIKDEKYMKQTASYEELSSNLEERDDLTYTIDNDNFMMDDFIKKLAEGIKDELNNENVHSKKKLNENERKVGLSLIEILENWETAFESMDGGSKYNKNSVLETMRNYTNLSTKDIRVAMKRYIILYKYLKLDGL
jgi:hypothetical protein